VRIFGRQLSFSKTPAPDEQRAQVSSGYGVSVDTAWSAFFGGASTASGASVTPQTAVTQATVFACIRVINDALATVPLKLYRKTGNERREEEDHPLRSLLRDAPNGLQTSVEWRDMLQTHLCLRGNAFTHVRRNFAGEVVGLLPIHPDGLTVRLLDGRLFYEGDTLDGRRIVGSQDEVLHVRGFGGDGFFGFSPIRECRETVGLSLTAERYGASLFARGANPGGVLEMPGKLSKEAAARLKDSFDTSYAGASNAGRTLLLEEGIKWSRVGLSADDAQFLETRKFQRNEIAAIFRVPPHMVADLERATFSNIEQQGIDFVRHCIRPWAERWESRLNHVLLTPIERASGLYIRFNLDGLLRGDQKSRFEAYAIGRQWGLYSADDCRELEELRPIPDGKGQIYLTPANMAPAGTQPTGTDPVKDAPDSEDDPAS
jgi:HK97 family phage portal protein